MKYLVAIGRAPGIEEDSYDSHHPPEYDTFSATDYVWVTKDHWRKISLYERPFAEEFKSFSKENMHRFLDAVALALQGGNILSTVIGQIVDNKMRLSGSATAMSWQFNAISGKLHGDAVRMVAFCGQPTLQKWSWFDVTIRYPFYKWLAARKNVRSAREHAKQAFKETFYE